MTDFSIADITKKLIEQDGWRMDVETARKVAGLPLSAAIELFKGAHEIRRHYKGDDVFTCTIINAKSGRCSQNCAFCAQSGHFRTSVENYSLISRREMVDTALEMADAGVTNYSIVTSGFRLSESEMDTVCETVNEIKQRTDLILCCSIGVLDSSQAERLVQSGVTNYHHNLETAESHFHEVCTTHAYYEDIESIRIASRAGLNVCSGGIFGLGETWEQRIEMAMTLKDLDIGRVPLNFIHPIPGTPMENRPLLSAMEALKCISLYRYMMPDSDITICGGRYVTLKDFQSWIFLAGANGVMTGNYLTTAGRDIATDLEMIADWQVQA